MGRDYYRDSADHGFEGTRSVETFTQECDLLLPAPKQCDVSALATKEYDQTEAHSILRVSN